MEMMSVTEIGRIRTPRREANILCVRMTNGNQSRNFPPVVKRENPAADKLWLVLHLGALRHENSKVAHVVSWSYTWIDSFPAKKEDNLSLWLDCVISVSCIPKIKNGSKSIYRLALKKPRVAKLKLKCLKFSLQLQIEERCAELILSDDKLRDVCQRLLVELNRGLNKDTNKEATVKCFPTYVRELPNGEGKLKILLLKTFRLLFYSIGYS